MFPTRSLTRLTQILALLLALGLVGCMPTRGGGGSRGDDDDATDDEEADDDDEATDDDVDATDDDDDATDDDDDDVPDNWVQADGTYQINYNWESWVEEEYGYWDCTATWMMDETSFIPPDGCPGCFATFAVEFDFFSSNCPDDVAAELGNLGVTYAGVAGNTLFRYFESEGDWFSIINGLAGGSSFTAESEWFDESDSGYTFQELYTIDW